MRVVRADYTLSPVSDLAPEMENVYVVVSVTFDEDGEAVESTAELHGKEDRTYGMAQRRRCWTIPSFGLPPDVIGRFRDLAGLRGDDGDGCLTVGERNPGLR